MPTPKSKLSKFILSLPATLTGSEVVERAKAKGMKTSGANVYRVRGLYGPKATKTSALETTKPRVLSKSDFIRQQPVSLSAAEVVAKAKAQGLSIHVDHVYKVRGPMGERAKKSGTKEKSTPSAKRLLESKADFVRARAHLSPKEIVEDAKAGGIKLDVRYVYNVRGGAQAARKKKRPAAQTMTSTPTSVNGSAPLVAAAAIPSSAEDLLRAVAAELGLGRAVEILAEERAKVRAVIGG